MDLGNLQYSVSKLEDGLEPLQKILEYEDGTEAQLESLDDTISKLNTVIHDLYVLAERVDWEG